MAKSSNKKKTATKVGKGKAGKGKAGKAGKAVSNKIEIVEQNEEDGGDEMVIDIEMVDEEDGGDTSGTSDDADEDMEDASNDSMSASSEDANGADSNSKKTSGSTGNSGIPIPFLDTFYALSAENANERAAAAHCLIRHCFPGDDAPVQTKDAAYALRRLLSGLCSGRAGARQGYASALSSFLRIAFATTSSDDDSPIYLIQKELNKAGQDNDDDDVSMDSDDEGNVAAQGDDHPAEFVRKLLLVQTTPQSVRGQKAAKKGSEERDYIFGRLFGIMAVVRSGTLFGADIPAEVSIINLLRSCEYALDIMCSNFLMNIYLALTPSESSLPLYTCYCAETIPT